MTTNEPCTQASTLLARHDLLSINEARGLLPGEPSDQTLCNWGDRGKRLPDGRVITLPTIRFGRRRFIPVDGLKWFLQQLLDSELAANKMQCQNLPTITGADCENTLPP